jgi:hypothetical protein
MPVQTQLQQRRGTAASWTSTNPTLAAGEIGFESDTGKIKIGTGSTAWNALAYTASSTAVTYLFNATAAQTTFSGADANGLTLAYTVGSEQVYLNGVLQVRGSDYTATNGTSIVLTSGALVSDVLNVIAFSALSLSDTYTQAQADAKFFQTANAFLAAKNKIINGDAAIAQRGTSIASVTTNNYLVDRFELNLTTMGTWTVSQESDAPAGFAKSLKALVTTADASPAASDRARIMYKNEGNAVQSFSYGNASAKTVTISFWVKSNVTGTYVLELFNIASGTSRHIASTYSVSASATWEKKSITFTGDTATAIVADNAERLSLIWYLGAGSDFTSGTLATSWANNVSANRAVGQTNVVGAINNYFQITGVQMEIGSVATPFQTATGTLQGELAACQRYLPAISANNGGLFIGQSYTTTKAVVAIPFPVTARVAPTGVTVNAAANFDLRQANATRVACSSVAFLDATPSCGSLDATATGLVVGDATQFFNANLGTILFTGCEL